MNMVVVLEFGHMQEVIPIILYLIEKEAEVLFQFLVDPLCLPICLRVVCCGGCNADSQQAVELMSKFSDKLNPSIQNHHPRQSMQLPNIV